ncbi:hypothetical protein SCG7086_AM_00020 [Chlamydiales bacterium SCGC AG-110-P3]|nr:hypothetical protein SCG7086_AM_00020 [Chlamydiales bacterium SCGC AG-110-P3]
MAESGGVDRGRQRPIDESQRSHGVSGANPEVSEKMANSASKTDAAGKSTGIAPGSSEISGSLSSGSVVAGSNQAQEAQDGAVQKIPGMIKSSKKEAGNAAKQLQAVVKLLELNPSSRISSSYDPAQIQETQGYVGVEVKTQKSIFSRLASRITSGTRANPTETENAVKIIIHDLLIVKKGDEDISFAHSFEDNKAFSDALKSDSTIRKKFTILLYGEGAGKIRNEAILGDKNIDDKSAQQKLDEGLKSSLADVKQRSEYSTNANTALGPLRTAVNTVKAGHPSIRSSKTTKENDRSRHLDLHSTLLDLLENSKFMKQLTDDDVSELGQMFIENCKGLGIKDASKIKNPSARAFFAEISKDLPAGDLLKSLKFNLFNLDPVAGNKLTIDTNGNLSVKETDRQRAIGRGTSPGSQAATAKVIRDLQKIKQSGQDVEAMAKEFAGNPTFFAVLQNNPDVMTEFALLVDKTTAIRMSVIPKGGAITDKAAQKELDRRLDAVLANIKNSTGLSNVFKAFGEAASIVEAGHAEVGANKRVLANDQNRRLELAQVAAEMLLNTSFELTGDRKTELCEMVKGVSLEHIKDPAVRAKLASVVSETGVEEKLDALLSNLKENQKLTIAEDGNVVVIEAKGSIVGSKGTSSESQAAVEQVINDLAELVKDESNKEKVSSLGQKLVGHSVSFAVLQNKPEMMRAFKEVAPKAFDNPYAKDTDVPPQTKVAFKKRLEGYKSLGAQGTISKDEIEVKVARLKSDLAAYKKEQSGMADWEKREYISFQMEIDFLPSVIEEGIKGSYKDFLQVCDGIDENIKSVTNCFVTFSEQDAVLSLCDMSKDDIDSKIEDLKKKRTAFDKIKNVVNEDNQAEHLPDIMSQKVLGASAGVVVMLDKIDGLLKETIRSEIDLTDYTPEKLEEEVAKRFKEKHADFYKARKIVKSAVDIEKDKVETVDLKGALEVIGRAAQSLQDQ